ncbi:uncharacterized protein LOC131068216 isoform X2 [Cryptomeria japonica]|nr:uncharacterized protein LOC131068216 isoform X2 [Cryptomeria japonica]
MTFPARHHIGAFLRILSEEEKDEKPSSSIGANSEIELANAIDAMSTSFERTPLLTGKSSRNYGASKTQRAETNDYGNSMEGASRLCEANPEVCQSTPAGLNNRSDENETITEGKLLTNQRKVAVLFELLAACVADTFEEKKKKSVLRKGYDARHRVSLRLLATWLDIKWSKVAAMELMVACSAMAALKEKEAQEQEEKAKGGQWSKWKRGGIIGAAALTGGALLAITGGLAAPAIAAGLTALAPTLGTIVPIIGASGFAAAATAAGSVAGSVAVAASFGAAGAGLSGVKMARRTGGIEEFEFEPIGENHQQGRLAVCILVSGFITEQEDFTRPWEGHDGDLERYAVRWESKNLIILSTAIQDWLTSNITTELMKQGAMLTVLSTLVAALAWPAALLSATSLIDGNWAIAVDRSDKAGVLLAEVLLKGLQGNRPVTLIGFSLGARMIFKCLQELAKKEESAGIVERVVLLGAPIPLDKESWQTARKMVAGRFINCYSTNDWILGITFRASLLTQGLAGIQPVDIPGIENVDVTAAVDGHSSYLSVASEILKEIELDSFYPVFSAKFHSR